MEWDLLADEPPPTGKKAATGRDEESAAARVVWFLALTVLGFSATSAALWYGPRARDYLKNPSNPAPGVDKKPEGGRTSNPLHVRPIGPMWDASQTPGVRVSPVPPFDFSRGNGDGNPNLHGGSRTQGFSIHR